MSGHNTLSEDDISAKLIYPALHKVGWEEDTQICRQVSFTKRVALGSPKGADFDVYFRHIIIAPIEAKKADVSAAHHVQHSIDWAASLDMPFVIFSNGQGLVFPDKTGQGTTLETSLALDAFPNPTALWMKYQQ